MSESIINYLVAVICLCSGLIKIYPPLAELFIHTAIFIEDKSKHSFTEEMFYLPIQLYSYHYLTVMIGPI